METDAKQFLIAVEDAKAVPSARLPQWLESGKALSIVFVDPDGNAVASMIVRDTHTNFFVK